MKKLLTLSAFCFVIQLTITLAQTTIYYQSFDGVTPPALPANWSSTSGTTQTINNTPYSGQANDQNLFMANCQPSGELRIVTLSNVNSVNKQDLTISFAHRRTNGFDTPITFEWSNDGVSWNSIAYSIPATSSQWDFYTSPVLPAGASNQANLRFRWSWATNTTAGCVTAVPNFRMDEVTIGAFPLPVTWLDLQVKTDHQYNYLRFATASEQQHAFFSVERAGSNRIFEAIDRIEGDGYQGEGAQYTYTDLNPLDGVNYYRLKQTDLNGKSTYSRVVSVFTGHTGFANLSPVPVRDELRVKMTTPAAEAAAYEVIDHLGRRVLSGNIPEESTEQFIQTDELPAGNYILRLKNGVAFEIKFFQKV